MSAIIKEYFNDQIAMRGPGNWGAAPVNTGATCVLRFADGRALDGARLGTLFAEVARDLPHVAATAVAINAGENRVEVRARPPQGYSALAPRTTGARG